MKQTRLVRRLLFVALVVAVAAGIVEGSLWLGRPTPIRIAFANSLTGPVSYIGVESLLATRLYLDEVNQAGGVDGHPVELVLVDDKGDPAIARANASAIGDGPALAVLGHFLSTASAAAGDRYNAERIPALTGHAYADAITVDNPYYFRSQVTNGIQARWLMEYIRNVLRPADAMFMRARHRSCLHR